MLRVKPLPIDTLRENVLVLSRDCTALRPQRISGPRKVEVRGGGRRGRDRHGPPTAWMPCAARSTVPP
jgi:hypothetical protein